MLVMPSDHAITDLPAFYEAIDRAARPRGRAGWSPSASPPTGPRPAMAISSAARRSPARRRLRARAFVEKPDLAHAEAYLADGDYAWNSGIFSSRRRSISPSCERLQPETVAACRRAYHIAKRDIDFLRLDKAAFALAENKSIDYAVMEHTTAPRWSRWRWAGATPAPGTRCGASAQDEHQDVRVGDVVAEDTKRSYLRAEHGLLVTLGVEDLVVVSTADAVLVARRDRAEEVSTLVKRLERDGRAEASANPIVHRPWGSFRAIHNGDRVQVKHITVKPGAKLSLQMHHHRAEHWVVVSGTAKVMRGNDEIILHEDQSTYIPIGTPHRLENPGKIMLHVIEVQSGSLSGRGRHRPLRGQLRPKLTSVACSACSCRESAGEWLSFPRRSGGRRQTSACGLIRT